MYLGYDRRRFRGKKGSSIPRGVLIEPQATNLLPDTVNLSTGWTAAGASARTPGQALRASTYGVRIDMNAGGGMQLEYNSNLLLPSATLCASVYWKKGTGAGNARLVWRNQASSTTYGDVTWTEAAPGVLTIVGNPFGTARYLYLGAGWYRVWVWSAAVVVGNGLDFFLTDASAAGTYSLWALPQLETGRFPSSPIPNTAAGSVTRSEDNGRGIFGVSNLAQGNVGSILHRATLLALDDILGSDQHLFKIDDDTHANAIHIRTAGSAGLRGYDEGQSLAQAATPLSTYYNRKTVFGMRSSGAIATMHAAGAQVAASAGAPVAQGNCGELWFGTNTGNNPINQILWEFASYLADLGAAALNAADAGAFPAGWSRYWDWTVTQWTGSPSGLFLSRSSTALDDQFVSKAVDTPRYAAGAF